MKTILTLGQALGGYIVDLWIHNDRAPARIVASVWYAEKPHVNWTRTTTGHILANISDVTFMTDELADETEKWTGKRE